jgi:hypothetical protein
MHIAKFVSAVATASLLGMVPASAYIQGNLETARPLRMAAATPMTTLSTMTNVPVLASVTVKSSDGMPVGTVKNVVNDADGKPSMVDVMLSDNTKTVGISASELSFDAASNTLVAALSAEQIKALPAEAS